MSANYHQQAIEMLRSVHLHPLEMEERREKSLQLAQWIMYEARAHQTYAQYQQQQFLAALMEDPAGKVFTTSFTDQCFRTKRPKRLVNQLCYLIERFGIPHFLSTPKRLSLYFVKQIGPLFPTLFAFFLRFFVRKECRHVIIPAERMPYLRHLRKRQKEGIRINLNHLGEAILGEKEAQNRLETYLKDLASPEVEYISVKISTLFSQIHLLAFEQTIEALSNRLRTLYRTAQKHVYVDAQGNKRAKFVNLDMEEYRDLHLTVALFKKVLSEEEFFHYSAGIVLQSYLPDAYLLQQELTSWAQARYAAGGAPIKIRLVKGANLAMEQVEASLRGWPQAPYLHKVESDANFKRMMHFAAQKEHAQAVHVGIASHNLFDIAYALLLRSENGIEACMDFEMLEGMADSLRQVVFNWSASMLLYCPIAQKQEFQNAIAYLTRRLDENTAPENFLRHLFDLIPDTREWNHQAHLFSMACYAIASLPSLPNRTQNRLLSPIKPEKFVNEPDTDWSLPANREWGHTLLKEWMKKKHDKLPLVVAEKEKWGPFAEGNDPSFPLKTLYHFSLAQQEEINSAIEAAKEAFLDFEKISLQERISLLRKVAHQIRLDRGDLVGAMVADGGKTVFEADVEVSEAIDFLEYYAQEIHTIHTHTDLRWKGLGVVVVAPPWNFPVAIPCGGIAAALAAGNSVILKPAPESVLAAYTLACCFWKAGINRSLLQFLSCVDAQAEELVSDKRISAVILTGGAETARYLWARYPYLHLLAETGGKNAVVMTSMADRDLAVRDLVHSAFGHAGQKCSAASLAIVEEELYEDKTFRAQLKDAVESLVVGSAWQLNTKVNPLIRPAGSALHWALTELEEGEEWLVKPQQDVHNPQLWSPGVKLGVKEGSRSHQVEFFGPLLSVMKAKNLQEALRLANATPYGLTAGLFSLDEREHMEWMEKIEAGNLYINRPITGAIVQRQPFGGIKQSSVGSYAKAGGPNYLLQLMQAEMIGLPEERAPVHARVETLSRYVEEYFDKETIQKWEAAIGSYAYYWQHHFSLRHDPSQLRGEANFFYYKPYSKVVVRLQEGDSFFQALCLIAAATTAGVEIEISTAFPLPLGDFVVWREEGEEAFIKKVAPAERVRLLSTPDDVFLTALRQLHPPLLVAPVLFNGRFELRHWLEERSLSLSYHRYGNLSPHLLVS